MIEERIKSVIRDVPDFPKPGIMFKDITPILRNSDLCSDICSELALKYKNTKIDAVAGVESRGFLFGLMFANALKVPFILVRKKGKLPYATISLEYELEYGTAHIEMQKGDILPGWNVLIHDDVLATGGTADAAARLIKMQQANIAGFAFLVNLKFLNGIEKINHHSENIISLVDY